MPETRIWGKVRTDSRIIVWRHSSGNHIFNAHTSIPNLLLWSIAPWRLTHRCVPWQIWYERSPLRRFDDNGLACEISVCPCANLYCLDTQWMALWIRLGWEERTMGVLVSCMWHPTFKVPGTAGKGRQWCMCSSLDFVIWRFISSLSTHVNAVSPEIDWPADVVSSPHYEQLLSLMSCDDDDNECFLVQLDGSDMCVDNIWRILPYLYIRNIISWRYLHYYICRYPRITSRLSVYINPPDPRSNASAVYSHL